MLQEGAAAPTLYDIGYALSQVPRFCGHTTERWTVLHHLYACAIYAEPFGAKVQLHAALHDAHEAVTSDIPQPWKTEDMRTLQQELDTRLFHSLHLRPPSREVDIHVHRIDNQMVYTEAVLFAPQVAEVILIPGDNFREGIHPNDEDAFLSVRAAQVAVGDSTPDECGKAYESFVRLLMEEACVLPISSAI